MLGIWARNVSIAYQAIQKSQICDHRKLHKMNNG